MVRKRRLLYFFAISTSVLMVMIIILILFTIRGEISPYLKKKNNLVSDNWNQRLIYDIQISQSICPYGYEPLDIGKTEKTNRGLVCGGELIKTNNDDDSCDEIDPEPQKNYMWRNSLICALKSSLTYNQLIISLPYKLCPARLIKCPYPIDTLNQFHCVNTIRECGINYIRIVDIDYINTIPQLKKIDFLDGKRSLLFGTYGNLPAFVDLIADTGDICANPAERSPEYNYLLNESYEYSEGCMTRIQGRTTNPHYKLLDTDTIQNAYSYINYRLTDLPLYYESNILKNNLNLYYSTYFGLMQYCDFSFFTFPEADFNFMAGDVLIITTISIILFILCFVSCRVSIYPSEIRDCTYLLISLVFFASIILFIGIWVYYSQATSGIASYSLHRNFIDKGKVCLDSFTNEMTKVQYESTRFFIDIFLIMCIWSTFLIFGIACNFCCVKCVFEKTYDWDL